MRGAANRRKRMIMGGLNSLGKRLFKGLVLSFVVLAGLISIIGTGGGGGGGDDTTAVPAAPTVTIFSPLNGAVFIQGQGIALSGAAFDATDGELTGTSVVWISSIDGQIGTGKSVTFSSASVGSHLITFYAVNSSGVSAQAVVAISVTADTNDPSAYAPTVIISSPANYASFTTGEYVLFSGSAKDVGNVAISGSSLAWYSSIDGALGTGTTLSAKLSEATHVITLTATDTEGRSASAYVTITVGNSFPTVTISSPENMAAYASGATVFFQASATDTEDGVLADAAFTWISSLDGEIGASASFSKVLSNGTHTIIVTVKDSNGATMSATVTITVGAESPNPGTPPTVTITNPDDSSTFEYGEYVMFTGSATDVSGTVITGTSLAWVSNVDGQLGTGASLSINTLSSGLHTIFLTATDANGLISSAAIVISIGAQPGSPPVIPAENQGPTAAITAPADGSAHVLGAYIVFTGTGTDPEDGAP